VDRPWADPLPAMSAGRPGGGDDPCALYSTPAGATPIPERPNTTLNVPLTVSPSAGSTMYTSAPSADGVVREVESPEIVTGLKSTVTVSRAEVKIEVNFVVGYPWFLLNARALNSYHQQNTQLLCFIPLKSEYNLISGHVSYASYRVRLNRG